jgi:hypothetical protein
MSSSDFKPRKARKQKLSDNVKTARNRAAEVAKTGFEAAELKAKSASRVNKSRGLRKLQQSPGWIVLSEKEQEKRELEVVVAADNKFCERMDALHREWGRKLAENDFDSDEETKSAGDDAQLEISDGDSEEWEDIEEINETLHKVFKESEHSWDLKMVKWEQLAWKEQENSL